MTEERIAEALMDDINTGILAGKFLVELSC